ncbi:MAG TPA: hypothetical protein VFQ87_17100 [Bradyrhizobium sp.]|jgi:hypothetical protein|nr:hypothetical protein [Bradyrhizobium sp.]
MTENDDEPEAIDPADLPAVLEGLAQAKRREFATDAEVEAAFRRFEPGVMQGLDPRIHPSS